MQYQCPVCGNIVPEGVTICPNCGQIFSWQTSVPQQNVSQPLSQIAPAYHTQETHSQSDSTSQKNKTIILVITIIAIIGILTAAILFFIVPKLNKNQKSNNSYNDINTTESKKASTASEKTTTNETKDGYIKSIGDLSNDNFTALNSFATDFYENAGFDSASELLVGINYVGDFVLTNNDPDSNTSPQNILILVYYITIKNIDYSQNFEEYTQFYWFMGFCNVDNSFTNVEDLDYFRPKSVVDINSGGRIWEYKGYYSIEEMKAKEFNDSSFKISESNVH